jgi:SAM-dependent methyltransferase
LEASPPAVAISSLTVTPGAPACAGPLFELARRAARAGCRVRRLYFLPEAALAADDSFRRHAELDRAAGISVTCHEIAAAIAGNDDPVVPLLDCTLWLDAAGGGVLAGRDAGAAWVGAAWTVSERPEDLAARRALLDEIAGAAPPLEPAAEPAAIGAGVLREPIFTSAPLARLAAPALCRRGTDADCSWYHGHWQYLRILGVIATPWRHAGFYAETLGAAAAGGDCRRILISANADYAMLAHLLHAYGEAAREAEIAVVDICETPLMLCKWYAQRLGLRIETEASNLLDWQSDKRFDLVVTHSFLQMVPPAARAGLMAKWRQVLRPGGRMISVTRINPDWTPADALPSEADVARFRDTALAEARKWQNLLGISADGLADAAAAYLRGVQNYPLRSEAELRALFTDNGFTFERFDLTRVEGKAGALRSGGGASRSATYAEFVAIRD